jgi:hypothetical protein
MTGSFFAAYVPGVAEDITDHHSIKGIPGRVEHPHVDLVAVSTSHDRAIRTDPPIFLVGPYSLMNNDEVVRRRGW